MKKIKFIKKAVGSHWVGDGFPVKTIFSYNDLDKDISPFLLMDHAGPYDFSPTKHKRGVGEHPHRGFETVTIVYDGEVEHRDSSGGGGIIKKGDTQWMTAASGLVHEEFHSKKFSEAGGRFEMIQLWVNLPKKYKMSAPRYQAIKRQDTPVHELENNAGVVKVIAGNFQDISGIAKTYSPINLWDLKLNKNHSTTLAVPDSHTAALFILDGEIKINDEVMSTSELVIFEKKGTKIQLEVTKETKALFLGGEVIEEPIFGHGPFVMNNQQEIQQAILDFRSGKMGRLSIVEGTE